MCRQAAQTRKKTAYNAPKIPVFLRKIAMYAYAAWLCMKNPELPPPAAPALARPEALYAPALKGLPEAGRRGGESIARQLR